ncbi:MAG: excisionase family DNA binding protein [Gammaproteobacteria bacterium]|jgi:excisionase family DNA binding protein
MATSISFDLERLNRPEAARYLGVSVNTLEVWASTGRYELPFVRIGRRVFYRRSDLDAFIDRRTIYGRHA